MNRQPPNLHEWSRYLTPSPPLRKLGLVCLGVGAQDGQLPPVVNRTLDHYALVYVERGTGWLITDKGRQSVTAGSLFWLSPGVEHSYGPAAQGWSEQWVLFEGPATKVYERLGLISPSAPLVRICDRDAVSRIFANMRHSAVTVSPPLLDAVLSASIQQMVIQTGLHGPHSLGEDTDRVLHYLEQAAGARLSVAGHARELGLSLAQLRAIVREASGLSPKAYLVNARIDRAKALLAGSDLPISRISTRVGYDDAGYFTRLFTRHVGIPPSLFREHYLRSHNEGARDS